MRLAVGGLVALLFASPVLGQTPVVDQTPKERPAWADELPPEVEVFIPPDIPDGSFIEEGLEYSPDIIIIPETLSLESMADNLVWPGQLEFYRWDKDEDILVLKTDTRRMQAKMLTRMAAFYEMNQTRGTILDNDMLAELLDITKSGLSDIEHSHAYTVREYAEFFRKVRKKKVQLIDEEGRLLHALLASGLIDYSFEEGYIPKDQAAVITLPQDIHPDNRSALLHHKLASALYQHDPDYAERIDDAWDSLDHRDRTFFRAFLTGLGYRNDEDLIRRKFQAYLGNPKYPIERKVDFLLHDGKMANLGQKHQILQYLVDTNCDYDIQTELGGKMQEVRDEVTELRDDPMLLPVYFQSVDPVGYDQFIDEALYGDGSCSIMDMRAELGKKVERYWFMKGLFDVFEPILEFIIPEAPEGQ